jgi:type II secretory pathway predicted ATPase ExeA
MSSSPWVTHFRFTRTPFGKNIPAAQLFVRDAHAEAVARIHHCVQESALGVITGEFGAGKTVAVRAAVAGLDPTRHHIIYIPNPAFGTRVGLSTCSGPSLAWRVPAVVATRLRF